MTSDFCNGFLHDTGTEATKGKTDKLDFMKLKTFVLQRLLYFKKVKKTYRIRKNFQIMDLIGLHLEYIKKSCNLIVKRQMIPFKKQEKYLNRRFFKEDIHMANKHRNRFSISLIISEMNIKAQRQATRYLLEGLQQKILTISNMGKDVKQQECLYISEGNVKRKTIW